MASLIDESGTTVFSGTITGATDSQTSLRVTLRHSAAFANIAGNAPVAADNTIHLRAAITLPPSAVGNNSIIDVVANNDFAVDMKIGGSLIVQSADGMSWIEQDTSADQTIAAGGSASIDFDTNGGGAGVGLSWDAVGKQVDIASAGVYSAFATLTTTIA